MAKAVFTKDAQTQTDEPIQPWNLDAERAVLGAILLGNDVFERVARLLKPHDFFRQAHQQIFGSMVRLLDRANGAVEFVTLADDLEKRGELTGAGGRAYLSALVDGLPRAVNVEHYAQVVREKALYRGLIAAGREMQRAAHAQEDSPTVLIQQADRRLVDLQRTGHDGGMSEIAATTPWLIEDLEDRVKHRGELRGLDTGFESINSLTMGWQRGDVIVVGARPSVGKTTFAMNSAVAVARSTRPDGTHPVVAFFSMEMRRMQLEYRVLASLSGIDLSVILRGLIYEDSQWAAIAAARQVMADLAIHIDDTTGRTVADVRRECRRVRAERGLDLVVIDYVQLMTSDLGRRGGTRAEELSDISRRLKILAGELDMPVILLSQLNRASESHADQEPKLSDFRDSGAIEQDADLGCLLHRKNYREGGKTFFILAKQRNGPTGAVKLTLHQATTTFTDGCDDPDAEYAPAPEGTPAPAAKKRSWPPKARKSR